MKFDKETAWHALQTLLICLGGLAVVVFAFAVQWWLIPLGLAYLFLMWYILYRLELGISLRKASKSLPILFLLLMAGTAHAEPHKIFYKNGYWWLGRAVSAAAITVDVVSTEHTYKYCPSCGDAFPFFSTKGTGHGIAAGLVDLGISTGFTIGEYHFSQYGSRPWRIFGYVAEPITDGITHGWAADHNYKVAAECRQAGIVCH